MQGDAEDLPFPTDSFDRYVSAGSIEYWPEPQRGIREVWAVALFSDAGGTRLQAHEYLSQDPALPAALTPHCAHCLKVSQSRNLHGRACIHGIRRCQQGAEAVWQAYRVTKPGGLACVIGPVHPTFWLSRFFADVWMLFPTEDEYTEVCTFNTWPEA